MLLILQRNIAVHCASIHCDTFLPYSRQLFSIYPKACYKCSENLILLFHLREKNPNYVAKTVEDFEIKDNPALANEKKSPANPMRENMPVIMEVNEEEPEVSKPIEEPAKSVSIESQVK